MMGSPACFHSNNTGCKTFEKVENLRSPKGLSKYDSPCGVGAMDLKRELSQV
jgi:hypothetical protein